jgi:hypothetical protein
MKNYIYRVENDDGIGCYSCHFSELEAMYIRHKKTRRKRPLPQMDKGIDRNMTEAEICGFISLRQAEKWFTKNELNKLLFFGCSLKKVKISKITARGQKQVLAIR